MFNKKSKHPIDDEIIVGKTYSPRERMNLAETYGVNTAYVEERIQAKGFRSCLTRAVLVLAFLSVGFFSIKYMSETEGNEEKQMTPNERYENLSQDGKDYVDEKMKKYDEFCAQSPEC